MATISIEDLKQGRESRILHARVNRAWKVIHRGNIIRYMHVVLIDSQGDKIQASMSSQDCINKLEKWLLEGRCIQCSKFITEVNDGPYKATKNKWKLKFTYATKIEWSQLNLPWYKLNLENYEDILKPETEENLKSEYLIDVLGVISEHGQLTDYQKEGNISKRITFLLSDANKNSVKVSLFDEQAIEMDQFINNDVHPKILLMEYAKINNWHGSISINTCWTATRILYNPKLPEVEEFQSSITQNYQSPMLTQSATQFTAGSRGDKITSITDMSIRKSIAEIKNCLEPEKYDAIGTISYVIEDNNWYYNACGSCKTKVIEKQNATGVGTHFYCEDNKCKKIPDLIIPKYKIQLIMVSDSTGKTCFTLFDSLAFKTFHKTAVDMLKELDEIGDPYGFPPVIYTLCDREFVFLIDINLHHNILRKKESYTIIQMIDDEDIIKAFQESNTTNQPNLHIHIKFYPLHQQITLSLTWPLSLQKMNRMHLTHQTATCKGKKSHP